MIIDYLLCVVCLKHDHGMRFLLSSHHNARPAGSIIDLIVLHAISLPVGRFESEYIEAFFMGNLDVMSNPDFADLSDTRVSAHFVVDRKGKVTQFVPTSRRAWHAGQSSWPDVEGEARENCNDYSVGIEMIGDESNPFTQAQYRETARLCRTLMAEYHGITTQRIVGHQDIAPGRKWDPGKQWDWAKFYRSLSRIRNVSFKIKL